ncbi:ABC transporter ATP-binding protein [Desulfovibrio sp. OttesenSCG-928-G11]|nr:ABC transporter ATP-binding protein [Desulfovibrio sp. OttesenSCG-928-G11]
MNDVAIRVSNLSKCFKLYNSPRAMLWELVSGKKKHREFWALKDINFEVKKGEIVGVLGRNGAGKSTLLKILTGVLDKTSGEVEINGRISSILELGTGFHPDYTGRENIVMGGMCLGMTEDEVLARMDSIIAFSELERVIDQPFRTYSSGMQARLTFSVAISVDPDIFIVDEALAAGDAIFVNKCTKRIQQICQSGATVFFVTHAPYLVYELCSAAIWVEQGKVFSAGPAVNIAKAYEFDCWNRSSSEVDELNQEKKLATEIEHNKMLNIALQTGKYEIIKSTIRITNVELWDSEEQKILFTAGDTFTVKIYWEGETSEQNIYIGLGLTNENSSIIMGYESWTEGQFLHSGTSLSGKGCVTLTIPSLDLGPGKYYISVSLAKYMQPWTHEAYLHRIDSIVSFQVKRRQLIPASGIYDPKVLFYDEVF